MSEKHSQNYAFSVIFNDFRLQYIANFRRKFKPSGVCLCAADAIHSQEIRLIDVVFPDSANHYGTLFGGNALNLMGKAAFIAATRHARQHVVMASSEKITFDEPVRVGDLVECVASIARVGRVIDDGCRRSHPRGCAQRITPPSRARNV